MTTANVPAKLHHETHGTAGPWVTLLHGGLTASASWNRQVRDLSPNVADVARVLTCDLRGYGRSPLPEGGAIDPATMAGDVVALWDGLGLTASTVVGFSMGGFVAQELALRVPDRVSALVLASTTAKLPTAGASAFAQRADELEQVGLERELDTHLARAFSERFREDQPELMEDYGRQIAASDPAVVAETFRALARFDRSEEIGTVACPTLVVCGEEDRHLGPSAAEPLAEAIPGAELVVIPGAGHTVQVENPNAFNTVLVDFLGRRDVT